MTTKLAIITLTILIGSISASRADQKKKNHDPGLEKYQAIEKKLKAAVKAGEISTAEAKKKLAGIKTDIKGRTKAEGRRSGKGKKGNRKDLQIDAKSKFSAMEKAIKEAVKKGKLSKDDAIKKLEVIKKEMAGGKGEWEGKKKQADGRESKFRELEEKIWGAVKSGKMSKADAEKKLSALKSEIWPDEKQQVKKNDASEKSDPRKARYEQAEKQIISEVKSGKLSKEDAGRKLAEIKNRLWGGDKRSQGGEQSAKRAETPRAKYEAVAKRIAMAIKEGKISKEDGEKRLQAYRKQLGDEAKAGSRAGIEKPKGGEEAAKRAETPRAKYEAVAKRIAIAVKEGKISKEDGEKRLQAYRKQLGAGARAGSGAGNKNKAAPRKIPGRPR